MTKKIINSFSTEVYTFKKQQHPKIRLNLHFALLLFSWATEDITLYKLISQMYDLLIVNSALSSGQYLHQHACCYLADRKLELSGNNMVQVFMGRVLYVVCSLDKSVIPHTSCVHCMSSIKRVRCSRSFSENNYISHSWITIVCHPNTKMYMAFSFYRLKNLVHLNLRKRLLTLIFSFWQTLGTPRHEWFPI